MKVSRSLQAQAIARRAMPMPRTRSITSNFVRALLDKIFKTEGGFALDYSDLTDEKIAWRRNLFAESEMRNGLTDVPTRSGVTLATLAPYCNAIQFVSGGDYYAYKVAPAVAGMRYWLSVIVKMDDGNAPAFTGADASNVGNDFVLVVKGDATSPLQYVVTALGNSLYRVSTGYTPGSYSAGGNWGVVKYASNSTRGFKVTAYQLERGPALTAYQSMTDISTELLAAYPTHSLFQDAIGTLAVFDKEHPIGLALDVRGGPRGAEKTVNGDFSGAVTSGVPAGWTAVGGATATVSGGIVSIGPLSNSGGLSQDIAVTANAWVEIKVVARRAGGTDGIAVWGSGAASYANNLSVVGGNFQEYSWRVNSPTGVVRVYLQALVGNGVLAVKSVSTKEIPGAHAVQSTTGDRPVMSGRWNLLGASEQINVAPWSKLGGVTVVDNAFTGPDAIQMSLLTGVAATTVYAQQSGIAVQANSACTVSCYIKQGNAVSSLVRIYNGNVSASIVGVIVNWNAGVASLGSTIGTWTYPPALEPTSMAGVYRLTGQFSSGANTGLAVILYPSAGNLAETAYFGGVQLTSGAAPWRYQRTGTVTTDYEIQNFPRGARFNGSNSWMQILNLDLSSSDKIYAGVSFRKEADPSTAVDCVLLELGTLYTSAGRFVLASSVGGSANGGYYVRGSSANTGSGTSIPPGTATTLSGGVDWNDTTAQRLMRNNGVAVGGTPQFGSAAVGGSTQTGAVGAAYIGRRAGTGTGLNGMVFRVGARTTGFDNTMALFDRWLLEPMKAIA